MAFLINPYIFSGQTLDDFDYVVRIEPENASRNNVTANGNAELKDSRSKVGLTSLFTDNSPAGWVDFPVGSGQMPSGADDFTCQFWISLDRGNGTDRRLCGQGDSGGSNASVPFLIKIDTSNKVSGQFFHSGGTITVTSTTSFVSTVDPGIVYQHVAFCRDGNTIRLYIDGIQEDSASVTGLSMNSSTNKFSIGRLGEFNGKYCSGFFNSFQVTRSCIYPSGISFTPSSDLIEPDADTLLLLNTIGSNGSKRIIDDAKPDDLSNAGFFPDISGNENDLTPVDCVYNEIGQNSMPDITFNGTSSIASLTLSQSQPFTIFCVANIDADTVLQVISGDSNSNMGLTASEYMFGDAGIQLADSTDRSGAYRVFAIEFNSTNSKLWVDGSQVATGNIGTSGISELNWGGSASGTDLISMTSSALLVRDSTDDVSSISNLLKSKYGI